MDIADTLAASWSRWRLCKVLLVVLSAVFLVGARAVLPSESSLLDSPTGLIATTAAVFILGAIAFHGRASSTVSLNYDLSADQRQRFELLTRTFSALAGCDRIWRIPLEQQHNDWKRNAGALASVERKQIQLTKRNPPLVKANVEFLRFPLGKETIYLTPDAILVAGASMVGVTVAGFNYNDVDVVCRQTRFMESDVPPSDAEVVGETWLYVNRNGGPDRRFNDNRRLPICLYGEIDFRSATGLNERLNCSRVDRSEEFVSSVAAMRGADTATSNVFDDLSSPVSPPVPPTNEDGIFGIGRAFMRGLKNGLRGEEYNPERNTSSARVGSESECAQAGIESESNTTSDIGAAYANETETARSLALNHGPLWEILLVQELLTSKLPALKWDCDHFDDLLRRVPKSRFTNGPDFLAWLGREGEGLTSASTNILELLNVELPKAVGQPGAPGDAIKILDTVNSIFDNCQRILNFELAITAADVPRTFNRLKGSFRDITVSVVRLVEDLSNQLSQKTTALKNGDARKIDITVNVDAPQFKIAAEEIERLRQNYPKLFLQ